MHLAVIAAFAPSLVNFRGPLLRELVAQGHRVTALAPADDADARTRSQLAELGVELRTIPMARTGTSPKQDLTTLASLTRELRRLKPDAVFSYTVKPVVYGSLAARLAGVRHVVAMVTGLGHAFIEGEQRRWQVSAIVRTLYRIGLRACDRVIFHNEDDRRLFLRDGLVPGDGRAIVVEGSGVDTERFCFTPLPEGPPVFLLIARLLREKGVVEYVEAARRVRRRHPEVRFRLVGPFDSNPSGIGEAQVRAWVEEGAIDYVGPVADVRPELEGCHVYVLPSYREGLPRTNLEAMAVGRPIVTTDVPGCRQTVVEGVTGTLVRARDAASLSAGIEGLLDRRADWPQMGVQARAMVEARFSLAQVNRLMMESLTEGHS